MRGGREKRCECVRKRTPPYPFPPQYSKANRFAAPTRLPAFGCRAVFYPLPQLSRSPNVDVWQAHTTRYGELRRI